MIIKQAIMTSNQSTQFSSHDWNNLHRKVNSQSSLNNKNITDRTNKKKNSLLSFFKTTPFNHLKKSSFNSTSTRLNESILLGQLQAQAQKKEAIPKKIILVDTQLLDSLQTPSFQYFDYPQAQFVAVKRFEDVLIQIQSLLKKNSSVYLFTKSGNQISDFASLPSDQFLVFVSTKPFFLGIEFYKKKPIYQNLLSQENYIGKWYADHNMQFRSSFTQQLVKSPSNSSFLTQHSTKRLKSLQYTIKEIQDLELQILDSKKHDPFPYTNKKQRITSRISLKNLFSPSKTERNRTERKVTFTNEEIQFLNRIDEPIDIDEYIKKTSLENIFVEGPSMELSQIVTFYDNMLKSSWKYRRSPQTIQEFPATNDPNEKIDRIGNFRIGMELQSLLEKEIGKFQIGQLYKRKKVLPESVEMMTRKVMKIDCPLYQQNIPRLKETNNFSRYQLHSIYILYKVLHIVTAQKYKYDCKYKISEGIDYNVFREGIYQIFLQSEKLARGIFQIVNKNFSGFLDWKEFLELMSQIQARSKEEKVDVFIRVADEDGNGKLSYEEVEGLCRVTLQRYNYKQLQLYL